MFKVGDAVRVKAGSPKKLWGGMITDVNMYPSAIGKKLIVELVINYPEDDRVHLRGSYGGGVIETRYLEPWNDSEEWDGEKWVAKKVPGFKTEPHLDINYFGEPPVTVTIGGVNYIREEQSVYAICDLPYATKPKPAIVILREDGILKPSRNPTVHESTRKAKAEAKRLAEKYKGQEFVVFQEVDRKKVEKPVYPELKRGDVMRALRDSECEVTKVIVSKDDFVVVTHDCLSVCYNFNATACGGTRCFLKSDFIKIGHVDLWPQINSKHLKNVRRSWNTTGG